MKSFIRNRKAPTPLRQHRRKARSKSQRIAGWVFPGLAVLVVAVLVTLGARYVITSDIFALKELKIHGCHITSPGTIAAHAQINMGMNLLSIDLMKASARLERYPYVSRAVLKRRLPGTLEIFIEERQPRALVKLDSYYLVDHHGEIFKKADVHEQHYPVMTGISREDFSRDSEECLNNIRSALALLDRIEMDDRFKEKDFEIAIDKNRGFTIITRTEGMEVFVGNGDFDEKLKSLRVIVDDLKSRGFSPSTIQIKSPTKAYVTVKG